MKQVTGGPGGVELLRRLCPGAAASLPAPRSSRGRAVPAETLRAWAACRPRERAPRRRGTASGPRIYNRAVPGALMRRPPLPCDACAVQGCL